MVHDALMIVKYLKILKATNFSAGYICLIIIYLILKIQPNTTKSRF